jgi:hypothetical protein
VSDEELSSIRGDLLNLDRFLGPYPFDVLKRWKDLTSKVTGMCNVSNSTVLMSKVTGMCNVSNSTVLTSKVTGMCNVSNSTQS